MPCKLKHRRTRNHWLTKTSINQQLSSRLQMISSGKGNRISVLSSVPTLVGDVKQRKPLLHHKDVKRATYGVTSTDNLSFSLATSEKGKQNLDKSSFKAKAAMRKRFTGTPSQNLVSKVVKSPDVQDSADDDKLTTEETFDWNSYLKKTDSIAAPQSAFKHVQPLEHCCFEAGMKLECPNKDGSGTYWLATVIAKAPPLILVRYEGYEDDNSGDFWVNVVTDDIHPVGWCSRSKHSLRPPKAIHHKQKDWYQYLIKNLTGARKAADSLFNVASNPLNEIKAGLLVEVVDPQDPKRYWFASITEVYAGRLRLQYKGILDSDGELWLYYLDERLQVVGSGAKKQMTVAPPGALLLKISSDVWPHLKLVDKWQCHAPSQRLSTILQDSKPLRQHNFQIGMKLEAKHPRDPSKICVATVARVYNEHHFLVRIDNLLCTAYREGENSIVCHRDSHGIYPVGWCNKNAVTLHPPKGYNGHFTWNSYLKYCKSVAAPESCFDTDMASVKHGFSLGMKLEAVDQEEPSRVCVATVTLMIGRTLWVSLDGESRSEQIFDALAYDLFPAGWCSATGHELQWPRPDTIEQKNRISRLRVTSDRITRLETLRKGRFKRQNSHSGGSNENSDHESPAPKKSKKVNKARYVRGRKQIKSKEANTTQYNVLDRRYIDPTMPYVCIQEIGKEFNSEEQIRKSFNLDEHGNLPKVVVTLDSDDEDKEKNESNANNEHTEEELTFLSYMGIKPKTLPKAKEIQFYSKPVKKEEVVVTTTVKAPSRSGKGSLDSIVAMLRNSTKPKLLDSFRREKGSYLPNGKIHLCAKHMHQYARTIDRRTQPPTPIVNNGTIVRTKSSMISIKPPHTVLTLPGDRVTNSYPAFVGKNLTATGVEQPVVTNRPVSHGMIVHERAMGLNRRDKLLPSAKMQTTRLTRNKENISTTNSGTTQEVRYTNGQQYRVVKSIVSDDGASSKIVIRLAKPSVSTTNTSHQKVSTGRNARSLEQGSECSLLISDVRSVAGSQRRSSGNDAISGDVAPTPTTITLDDDDDDDNGDNDNDNGDTEDVDHVLPQKIDELKELCRDLPENPGTWTKHHVAKFIGLADCQPYARIFSEQDVDGPAFLLLTIHEIHKILGVTLGPALKLADHIQTLQKMADKVKTKAPYSR